MSVQTEVKQEWYDTDYYDVLGISEDADITKIKKAYRKLARQHHPDSNAGNKTSEEYFKKVSAAYAVLSDSKSRSVYDQVRHHKNEYQSGYTGFDQPAENYADTVFFNFDSMSTTSSVFNTLFGFANSADQTVPFRQRGVDLRSEVVINFEASISGVVLPLSIAKETPCPVCQHCTVGYSCTTCLQTGIVTSEQSILVKIPAGICDGQSVKLKGFGGICLDGGPNGDLYINVRVETHPIFKREGDNILLSVPVTYSEAILGSTIDIPLPNKKVKVKLGKGSKNGQLLRLKNKGVLKSDGTFGDTLVTIVVTTPSKVTPELLNLVQQLSDLETENVRKDLFEKVRE